MHAINCGYILQRPWNYSPRTENHTRATQIRLVRDFVRSM